MMKLILSLTLIWTLSSTGEALWCWHGLGDKKTAFPCDSVGMCGVYALQAYANGKMNQTVSRSCFPPSLFSVGTHTFSINLGFTTAAGSVHVCDTDGCNNELISYPGVQKKNNLQCLSCNDESSALCKKTLQCEGVENRCFNGSVEDNMGATVNMFGCVSSNFCPILSSSKLLPLPGNFIRPPKCCEGSFCNSSWSVKLNVMTLLFGLITLIFY